MRRILLVLLSLALLVLGAGAGSLHAGNYTYYDLGTLGTPAGGESRAMGINASGQVVGWSYTAGNASRHAFLYSGPGGTMQDLGTLGGTNSTAYGINASGQVVGLSYMPGDGAYHAFLYPSPGGTMQDLGTLGGDEGVAYGINASGQVVGRSYIAGDGAYHAFLYTNGQMQDLNELVDLPLGVSLVDARGINDQGWIVGLGSNNHAYLLTTNPVPLPPTVLLLGSGLLGLAGWRRFRKS